MVNNNAAELFRKYGYKRDADIAFGCNYGYYVKRNEKKKRRRLLKHIQELIIRVIQIMWILMLSCFMRKVCSIY